VSRTTGRPAEVLREGSGIKVDGTADDELAAHISHILRMPGISPAKDLPGLLYLQRALSNEFLLGGDRDEFFDHRGCEVNWERFLRLREPRKES
jgi:hypothetical protein